MLRLSLHRPDAVDEDIRWRRDDESRVHREEESVRPFGHGGHFDLVVRRVVAVVQRRGLDLRAVGPKPLACRIEVHRCAAEIIDARPAHTENDSVGVEETVERPEVHPVGEADARTPDQRRRMVAAHEPRISAPQTDGRADGEGTARDEHRHADRESPSGSLRQRRRLVGRREPEKARQEKEHDEDGVSCNVGLPDRDESGEDESRRRHSSTFRTQDRKPRGCGQ